MFEIANESPRAIKYILKVEIIHMFVEHLILKNEHFLNFEVNSGCVLQHYEGTYAI